ncbi:acyltransferase family protein [Chitinophagaceae bacterium MMS25-I14]
MNSKNYMPALTGIRAIAAYLVFFHHYNRSEFPATIVRFLWEFHIGVNIFFVLSGFLIYFRYFQNVQIHRKWLGQYFINRIARIYPVYFVLTLITFYLGSTMAAHGSYIYGDAGDHHFKLLLLNLSFLKGFFSHLNFTGIAQGWTLTVEECFYALAPLFFILIKKDRKAFIYLPLIITAAGYLLVALLGKYGDRTHGFYGDNTFMLLYTFNGTCCEFFIGMALAMIILKKDDSINNTPVFTSLGFLIMIVSLLLLCSFKQTEQVISGLYHPVGTFIDHVFLPIGTAVFFYGLIKENSFIKRLLSKPVMVLLGKSSYAFYLVHVGFLSFLLRPLIARMCTTLFGWLRAHSQNWIPDHTDPDGIITILILFVLLNIASILIFRLFEEPLNKAVRSIYKRREAKEVMAVSLD